MLVVSPSKTKHSSLGAPNEHQGRLRGVNLLCSPGGLAVELFKSVPYGILGNRSRSVFFFFLFSVVFVLLGWGCLFFSFFFWAAVCFLCLDGVGCFFFVVFRMRLRISLGLYNGISSVSLLFGFCHVFFPFFLNGCFDGLKTAALPGPPQFFSPKKPYQGSERCWWPSSRTWMNSFRRQTGSNPKRYKWGGEEERKGGGRKPS